MGSGWGFRWAEDIKVLCGWCSDCRKAPWFASGLQENIRPDGSVNRSGCGTMLDDRLCLDSSIRTLANGLRVCFGDDLRPVVFGTYGTWVYLLHSTTRVFLSLFVVKGVTFHISHQVNNYTLIHSPRKCCFVLCPVMGYVLGNCGNGCTRTCQRPLFKLL